MLFVAAVSAVSGCGAPSAIPSQPSQPSQLAPGVILRPLGDTETGVGVIRVVDGDTIHVTLRGQDVTVRMVGIDTPETVKPESPIECFGPESSDFAKGELEGRTVTLEYDASQGRTDRYGRTLAYVWIEEAQDELRLFNLEAVAGGYAEERQYGSTPFAWKDAFRAAENAARRSGAGLWGACAT